MERTSKVASNGIIYLAFEVHWMPVLKESKDTQGINFGGPPNDNRTSDFSSPEFHAINDVCLHYVWFANTIVAKYVLHLYKKIARMIYICTTQLFCGLHLNNHIFYECINT